MKGGALYKRVLSRLDDLKERVPKQIENHARHKAILANASKELSSGNLTSARELMEAEGFLDEGYKGFSDLDYTSVHDELMALSRIEDGSRELSEKVRSDCPRLLTEFSALASGPKRVVERDKVLASLIALSREHQDLCSKVEQYSDLTKTAVFR
jgi:hypothetical protein